MSEKDEDNDNMMCYVAKKSCGCTVGAAVDMPEYQKDTAKSVAEFIEDGLIVSSMTVKEFRAGGPFGCKCKKDQALPLFPETPEATG